MFGRTARRELRDANALIGRLREDLTSARRHRKSVEDDRDMWQRRAIEYADRLIDVELELRTARREKTAMQAQLRRQEDTILALQEVNEKHYQELAARTGANDAIREPAAA